MTTTSTTVAGLRRLAFVLAAAAGLGTAALSGAQTPVVTKGTTRAAAAPAAAAPAPASAEPASIGPALELIIGKSTLLRTASPIERISVGNPFIADISLINPSELYVLGKNYGSTNLLIWRKGSGATAIDVSVSIDAERMERKLRELLPEEKGIRVRPAADSVILTGVVSSAVKARHAEDIANAFVREINRSLTLPVRAGDVRVEAGTPMATSATAQRSTGGAAEAKVVNLLQVAQAQQVMLEVKVAEVSKTLMDKLGVNFGFNTGNGGINYSILSNLLFSASGQFRIRADNGNILDIEANKKDGLIKVLAEPNIIAISGQEASFLAGGKIFIPVARRNDTTGGTTLTLEEKEFGVGLKFTPTVLEGGRIHMRVAPEVSELSQTGSPFTTVDNVTSVLPSLTTRRVQTSVQLMDGQSLAIAGLIKNNINETIKRTPLLGDIPILGALFRSSEFQNDRSELMFVITPRLVKPLDAPPALPTDSFTPPSRSEFFFNGQLEGSGNESVPRDRPGGQPAQPAAQPPAQPQRPQSGGFEVK